MKQKLMTIFILVMCSTFIYLTLAVSEWFVIPTYFSGVIQKYLEKG